MQVTYGNRSGSGRIDELSVETTSGAYEDITATVSVDWTAGGEMPVGTQNLSAEDLTELSMKVGLLGEPLPTGHGDLSFVLRPDDPLSEFQTMTVPEGSVQALARLLVVEQLVGSRRASAVEGFALGPAHRGQRHVELTWLEPQRYTNVDPKLRSISGVRSWG
jgi:hypothetical protein